MRNFLPLGVALVALGIVALAIYEGWSIGTDDLAISDYLRLFIADAPAVAVLLVFLIGAGFGALILHLWNK